MKKKLFLIALPALMVLSGCSAPAKAEENFFIEDTLAHEEIFGEPELQQRANVLRTVSDVESYFASNVPSIGIQTNDELNDGYAIRFVSAVRIEDEDLATANLSWVRSTFGADHRVIKSETSLPVEKLYTSLANGDNPITIQKFNQDNGTTFNYFAVYTLRQINLTNHAKYVINANLVCNGVSSKVLSTTVDQTTQFTFNSTDRGYFGVRKQANGFESFYGLDNPGSGNSAAFVNVPIEKDESFIVVNRAVDWFEIHGYDKTHLADSGDNNFGADAMTPFAKAKTKLLSYSLYLSSNEKTRDYIYSNRAVQFFFVPNDNWLTENARFALNVVVDKNNGDQSWYSMSKVGDQNLYVCTVPFSDIDNFGRLIFCRMNPNTSDNNWNDGVKWNQTNDLTWDQNNNQSVNKYTVAAGAWSNGDGAWSLQAIH